MNDLENRTIEARFVEDNKTSRIEIVGSIYSSIKDAIVVAEEIGLGEWGVIKLINNCSNSSYPSRYMVSLFILWKGKQNGKEETIG